MNNQSKFKVIEDAVRIGGKGSMRRKHKRVPNSAPMEARRLQATLGKLDLFQVTGIEQLTLSMDDQCELVFSMPHVQASTGSNMLVVTGKPTRVAAPSRREPEPGRPPSPCPSPPPPPPPPPPSPAFANKKSAKKAKKPRNRIRLRNKCVRERLLAGAGDGAEDSDLGSADDLLFSPRYSVDGRGGDSDDSDKTTVPSVGSEMDQTIVGADFLESMSEGKESGEPQTGSEESQEEEPEAESEENGEKVQDNGDDCDEGENEDLHLTLDDILSCLEGD